MGGYGSGQWYRHRTKDTVERSCSLAMTLFRGCIAPRANGEIRWTRGNGDESSIGYFVNSNQTHPIMTLHYCWGGKENIEIPVRLQSTPMHFTGVRWWFICPLIIDGVICNRRVGKLYLPPGAKYFGCRHCHRLSYKSRQEAHSLERFHGKLAKFAGNDSKGGEL